MEEESLAAETRRKAVEAKEVMSRAKYLAEYMKSAAMRVKLAEHEITLKKLVEAQNDDSEKILGKFKAGLMNAKMTSAQEKAVEAQRKCTEAQEREAALQVRFDEAHVRTLAAEDKVGKLQKELAGVKKMLDTLMK